MGAIIARIGMLELLAWATIFVVLWGSRMKKHYLLLFLSAFAAHGFAQDKQSLDDAWWTGPVLAAGASTLPEGHVLFEPYFYDAITYGHYDTSGNKHSSARTHSLGSQSYILYGLVEGFSVGLIPRFGYNDVESGADSSGIRVGDLTLQAQYRLSQFREGSRIPTVSVVLQETLPIGKYDKLGDRPSDGMGSGAYSTTIGIYSQYYFWMPNGRILRTRFNVSRTISEDADLEDVSVYGTPNGFRGTASPGGTLEAIVAAEYSVTSNWVLALDLLYGHDHNTSIDGRVMTALGNIPFQANSGSGRRFGIVPAIEYNISPRTGIILGARWFAAGRNTNASITPVTAINMVF
jgi:Putative MetA-pathway of phenol degradation